MNFLDLFGFTTATIGILLVSYLCGWKIRSVVGAAFAGIPLAIPAALFGGAMAGRPLAALVFSPYPPLIAWLLGFWIGRYARKEALTLMSGDINAYIQHLELMFGKAEVAALPWIAQDWRTMSAAQKTALVEMARTTAQEKLVRAHEEPVKLYETLYGVFITDFNKAPAPAAPPSGHV